MLNEKNIQVYRLTLISDGTLEEKKKCKKYLERNKKKEEEIKNIIIKYKWQ